MRPRWYPILDQSALILAVLVILSISTSGLAQAALITFKFTGVVDSADAALSPTIAQNTTFTGSYGFESTARNSEAEPRVGVYGVSHFSMEISGKHYSVDPNGSGFNGPAYHLVNRSGTWSDDGLTYLLGPDGLYAVGINAFVGDPVNGLTPAGFSIDLLGGKSIFPEGSDLLTPPFLSPPPLGNFAVNRVGITFLGGGATGHLTSLTLAPVPLPGALLLFGSSLLGLAGLGLRRRITNKSGERTT